MTEVSGYLNQNMTGLKHVLNLSRADQGRDLAYNFPDLFWEWAEQAKGVMPPEDVYDLWHDDYEREPVETLLKDDKDAVRFMESIENEASRRANDEGYGPPYLFMSYDGLVKNEWLIHFTSDAEGIASRGFTLGVADFNQLGLSTHWNENAKRGGGWNFAYRLKDFRKYGRERFGHDWKYGDEAVVFQASGVLIYHHGDEEPQVIFDGKTAKNIIPLVDGYDGWEVQSKKTSETLFVNEDLGRVTDWVVDNFRQYRRPLVGSSNKAALDAYMDELWEDSHPHPLERGARIIHNTWVEVRPFDGMIHLSFMMTLEPQKGDAKKTMKYLTDLADKHGVEMDLTAKAVGNAPTKLSTEQLVKFYKRYGFRQDGPGDEYDGYDMIRKPKGGVRAAVQALADAQAVLTPRRGRSPRRRA